MPGEGPRGRGALPVLRGGDAPFSCLRTRALRFFRRAHFYASGPGSGRRSRGIY